MKIMKMVPVMVLSLGLVTGCANMTQQQQRVLSGGAIGAGAGAALGAIAGGSIAVPAAIGAGAGALGGYIYDQSQHHK
jgi:hypothetical protein